MKYIRNLYLKVKSWLFGVKEPLPVIDLIEVKAKQVIEPDIKPIRKPRKKKEKLTWNSFKHLKVYVDNVYEELNRDDYFDSNGYSLNMHKNVIKGIRVMGPYMMAYPNTGSISLNEEEVESDDCVYMQADKRTTPSLAFIGFPDERQELQKHSKDQLYPRFLFAELLNKCEHISHVEVTKRTEVIYMIGVALYDEKPPRWMRKAGNKLQWVGWYAALDTVTGKTRLLRHWDTEWTGKHSRKILKGPNVKEGRIFKHTLLAEILNLWLTRDMHWQVQAVKKEKRITFCIDDNHAKDYFKDRYVMEGEKRKPIFHWVKSHYRKIATGETVVKTHTRGAQVFKWGDYNMAIRQPGKDCYLMSDFDIEPIDEAHKDKDVKYISMKKALKNIAKRELRA